MKISKLLHMPFKGLKDTLENRHFPLRERKDIDARTDEEIFREAMSDVREIPEYRNLQGEKASRNCRIPRRKDDSIEMLQRIVSGEIRMRLSDTGEFMAWAKPDIRKDIVEKLHSGKYSVQDSIDLHGMTLAEAEEALFHFFKGAIRKRLFCIKVIHGRGLRSPRGPVLKGALRQLLHGAFNKWILAYATARHSDGGLGATYIILKSR